jgi:hypothetical protein
MTKNEPHQNEPRENEPRKNEPRKNEKVYIHEYIDINGPNRAKYFQHITANWSPTANAERDQLCFGVWGTLGSTGRWPEVVNIWEQNGWDSLAFNFSNETSHPSMQDPFLEEWWAAAAPLRRGGLDRILVPAPWTRSIEQLIADGVRGQLYAHELVRLPPDGSYGFLDALQSQGCAAVEAMGLELVGAFRVAMADDTECIVIWAIPDWPTWVAFENEWTPHGKLGAWRSTIFGMGGRIGRHLMVDAPLNPLRIGRQPTAADRRPFSDF